MTLREDRSWEVAMKNLAYLNESLLLLDVPSSFSGGNHDCLLQISTTLSAIFKILSHTSMSLWDTLHHFSFVSLMLLLHC